MHQDQAELSTIATQIDDLLARVMELAEHQHGTELDHVALKLFEVERSLLGASRNLRSALRAF